MVLPVKPTAECIETAVLRPSLFIGQPTSQLLDENLLARFAQELTNILFRVPLRDQVDRRICNYFQAGQYRGWSDRSPAASPERAALA